MIRRVLVCRNRSCHDVGVNTPDNPTQQAPEALTQRIEELLDSTRIREGPVVPKSLINRDQRGSLLSPPEHFISGEAERELAEASARDGNLSVIAVRTSLVLMENTKTFCGARLAAITSEKRCTATCRCGWHSNLQPFDNLDRVRHGERILGRTHRTAADDRTVGYVRRSTERDRSPQPPLTVPAGCATSKGFPTIL